METFKVDFQEEATEQLSLRGFTPTVINGGLKGRTPKVNKRDRNTICPHIYNPNENNCIFDLETVIIKYSPYQMGEFVENGSHRGIITDIQAEYDVEYECISFSYWVDGKPFNYGYEFLL